MDVYENIMNWKKGKCYVFFPCDTYDCKEITKVILSSLASFHFFPVLTVTF